MRQDITTNLRPYAHIILEHITTRVALYDAHSLRLLDANSQYLEALKRFLPSSMTDEHIMGSYIFGHHLASPDEYTIAIFRNTATTGIAYQGDAYPITTTEGEITYWDWTLEPIPNEQGRVTYLLQTSSDVTQQVHAKQQQEILSQTNRELRNERHWLEVVETVARSVDASLDIQRIGNATTDAIYTHFHALGVALYVDDPKQQALRMLSVQPASLRDCSLLSIQQIPYEKLSAFKRTSDPNAPIIVTDLQADKSDLFIHSIPMPSHAHGFICQPLLSDNKLIGLLTTVFSTPILLDGPEVQALHGCGIHITTALKQAHKLNAIEYERIRLQTLFQQLPESIMIIDVTNSCIKYANPATAELFGLPLDQIEGTLLHQHPIARRTFTQAAMIPEPWNFAVIRSLGGTALRNQEAQVIQNNGNAIIVQLSSTPFWITNGVIKDVAIIMQDITAQKLLERQKNEFLSMLNHELRTPLTVIQGFAELLPHLLKQERRSEGLVHSAVNNIVEQSEHLVHLIEEMLDISRIEYEQFILQRLPHDLLHILSEAIRGQGITSKQHQLELVVGAGIQQDETLIGLFDEKRILQVLHNLIGNAIKYSPTHCTITIGVDYLSQQPPEILIWVKDKGVGIPAEHLPLIFKRFHRVNNQDHSSNGLGIGLYLVKEIITRHGGRVWAESSEGKGSTFFITLPLHADEI